MLRRLVLATVVAGLLAFVGGPATASAQVDVPPKLIAELLIIEEPEICHSVHRAVHLLGYGLAEESYEAGYGSNKHPSAVAVFHWLVKECR
jgi:hypothetical protein